MSTSEQKEIGELLEKDNFKVIILNKIIIPNKIIMPKKVLSNIQSFNTCFLNNIKNPYTNKAYEKSRPVVYIYNHKMENIVLGHSRKIPGVSQDISFCLASII